MVPPTVVRPVSTELRIAASASRGDPTRVATTATVVSTVTVPHAPVRSSPAFHLVSGKKNVASEIFADLPPDDDILKSRSSTHSRRAPPGRDSIRNWKNFEREPAAQPAQTLASFHQSKPDLVFIGDSLTARSVRPLIEKMMRNIAPHDGWRRQAKRWRN